MTISGFKYGDIFDEVRRKDRFLFDLPIKDTGLKIHEIAGTTGFNFYHQLIEDHGVPLDTYGGSEVGDVWTFEDEENYTTYHGIVAFSLDHAANGYTGYHPGNYAKLVEALDKLYAEIEGADEWTRPCRATMLGHGEYHADGTGIFPRGYMFPWNHELGLAALANTEFEVEVYSVDVPDLIAEQYEH